METKRLNTEPWLLTPRRPKKGRCDVRATYRLRFGQCYCYYQQRGFQHSKFDLLVGDGHGIWWTWAAGFLISLCEAAFIVGETETGNFMVFQALFDM